MKVIFLIISLFFSYKCISKTYYIDTNKGNDQNNGISAKTPFKSLKVLNTLRLVGGDSVLIAKGSIFQGTLLLKNLEGSDSALIIISSYPKKSTLSEPQVNAKGYANGILIQNCSFLKVENLSITADGGKLSTPANMRCGLLATAMGNYHSKNIEINNLTIKDIFFEEKGFIRDSKETKTENGTQKYGWGIRVINESNDAQINNLKIQNCKVFNVSHTGIKFTGKAGNIKNVTAINNEVMHTGGPGIQLSGVYNALISDNIVNGSGSKNDSRNWARGSGLWTWGCSNIIIQKNSFLNANGPGDSAGCHIDYNCKNVIVQYNLSANNAGGFLEILGNNYNCAYRYNISINDGYRKKGVDGAFQEGKIFWLSGYVGNKQTPKGPYNSYIYNNTIYTKSAITAQIAVAPSASGIFVANNIFYFEGESKLVAGDQYKAESLNPTKNLNSFFENNLFLKAGNWPKDVSIKDGKPIVGDAQFKNKNGYKLTDFIPLNKKLIKDKGIKIHKINADSLGLFTGLSMTKDILGNKITGKPDLGAIEIQ